MIRFSRFALLSLVLLLVACSKEPLYQEQAYVFGTQVDVSIYGEDEAKARQAVVLVMQEFQRLHDMLHAWKPSELSELNTAIAQGKSKASLARIGCDAARCSAGFGAVRRIVQSGHRRSDPDLGVPGRRFQSGIAG